MNSSQLHRWLESWWFSLTLLPGYLAVFTYWNGQSHRQVLVSGGFILVCLCLLWVRAMRRGYFQGRWDVVFHASVLLDIGLEAVLIREHRGIGFLLCALGFAVVIGWYRRRMLNRRSVETQAFIDSLRMEHCHQVNRAHS